jgi:hypothetical protein
MFHFTLSFLFEIQALRSAERNLLNALNDCNELAECKQVQKDYEIGLLDEIRIDYDKVSGRVFLSISLSTWCR